MLSPPTKEYIKRCVLRHLSCPAAQLTLYGGTLTSTIMGSTSVQDTILREVERYQQSHIQHSTAYGELDHPSYDSITFRELHMATVSHQVSGQSLQSTKRATQNNTETCHAMKLGCLSMSNSTLQMACMIM